MRELPVISWESNSMPDTDNSRNKSPVPIGNITSSRLLNREYKEDQDIKELKPTIEIIETLEEIHKLFALPFQNKFLVWTKQGLMIHCACSESSYGSLYGFDHSLNFQTLLTKTEDELNTTQRVAGSFDSSKDVEPLHYKYHIHNITSGNFTYGVRVTISIFIHNQTKCILLKNNGLEITDATVELENGGIMTPCSFTYGSNGIAVCFPERLPAGHCKVLFTFTDSEVIERLLSKDMLAETIFAVSFVDDRNEDSQKREQIQRERDGAGTVSAIFVVLLVILFLLSA